METLQSAYRDVKNNNGAPGIDGVTFNDIEKDGLEDFLEQIQNELVSGMYQKASDACKKTSWLWLEQME